MIETMGVCLVTGGKNHYSGLCVFGAQDVKATILAYAGLRVKTEALSCYRYYYLLCQLGTGRCTQKALSL